MTTRQGTCNEACWQAKEDVCHCMCGGVNHGIMRLDAEGQDGEQPGRYKQRLGVRYQLDSVHTTWSEANNRAYALQHEYNQHWGLNWWANSAWHEPAKDSQLKWPEVQGLADFFRQLGMSPHVYLVWVRLPPDQQGVW